MQGYPCQAQTCLKRNCCGVVQSWVMIQLPKLGKAWAAYQGHPMLQPRPTDLKCHEIEQAVTIWSWQHPCTHHKHKHLLDACLAALIEQGISAPGSLPGVSCGAAGLGGAAAPRAELRARGARMCARA